MAEIAYQPAQVLTITNPAPNLDPIDVIFLDHSPGRGRIIIRCYAQAWTAWWGAMGERHTVRTFFLSCDAEYLASNLIQGLSDQFLARKRDLQEVYLELICRAIQDALRAEAASPKAPAPQAVSYDLREAAQALVNAWPTGYSRTTHEAMAALQAALAANTPAGDDTRRLDWLSSTPASVVSDKQVREWLWKRPAGFDGIRRAIDAAMGNPDHTAPHQGAYALREALAWLVRLEDERIRLQNPHAMGHGTDYDHYHKTLPLAWATARAALAHHQAPQQGEQHE